MSPTRDQELAVLRSVVYASLFDYPLTLAQLEASLVGIRAGADTIVSWWRSSDLLQSAIECRDGCYFPAGRADLLATRSRREVLSRALLERDRGVLALISRMPFVRMVALSGSLAHLNADGEADLDLFVITAPHRVWGVTFTTLVISRLLGWRKRLCLNFVISERAMAIEPRDLFSANQIIHLKPIMGDEVFERFVKANAFVRDFYPNFELETLKAKTSTPQNRKTSRPQNLKTSRPQDLKTLRPQDLKTFCERLLSLGPAQAVECISRAVYGWHLRQKAATWQSREQVRLEPECLKLHTSSHRASTIEKFDATMTEVLNRQPVTVARR